MKVRAPEPSGTLGVRSLSGAQAAALMNCCDSWVRTILKMMVGLDLSVSLLLNVRCPLLKHRPYRSFLTRQRRGRLFRRTSKPGFVNSCPYSLPRAACAFAAAVRFGTFGVTFARHLLP